MEKECVTMNVHGCSVMVAKWRGGDGIGWWHNAEVVNDGNGCMIVVRGLSIRGGLE